MSARFIGSAFVAGSDAHHRGRSVADSPPAVPTSMWQHEVSIDKRAEVATLSAVEEVVDGSEVRDAKAVGEREAFASKGAAPRKSAVTGARVSGAWGTASGRGETASARGFVSCTFP